MQIYFARKGYKCFRFNYPSRTKNMGQIAEQLKDWLAKNQTRDPDFICHSMGGLICHAYFSNKPDVKTQSSVVCLGTPFQGSVVARILSRNKIGSQLLGVQTDSGLSTRVATWPVNSNLGIIAGSKNLGVGRLLGLPADQAGDGTILIDETRITGLSDHIILPVTHSQMTFSKQVTEQVDYFLNQQQFKH